MKQWIVVLLACALLASGCQKKSGAFRQNKQELRLNLHTEPPGMDPRKHRDNVSISMIKMFFEGLMRLSPTGELTPALAERVEISLDQKTYTFFLRKSIWSDGAPLTAYDFEKSWKTMLDPAFPCSFAGDLYDIKNAERVKTKQCPMEELGVHAVDPLTLVVELEHPTPYFLELTTHFLFPVPSHIAEKYADWAQDAGEHFVCNGPFCLKKWLHNNRLVAQKNGAYWDQKSVALEKITFLMIEDENTELSLFENGELDWAGNPLSYLPIDALGSLAKQGLLQICPLSGVYYYAFNTQSPPFDNSNMRKAFTLAINRKKIIENIAQSQQQPAMSFIPPLIWKEEPRPFFQDADQLEAKRLFKLALEEMGICKEKLPPIHLSYNTMSLHNRIAQAIQEQWFQVLGVQVILEHREWKVFLDEIKAHRFQIARMAGGAPVNDPIAFLQFYKFPSSYTNLPQWENRQFTACLDRAEKTTDSQERLLLLRQAEQIFMEEMPIAPIYFCTDSYVKKPYVKGVFVSPTADIDFKYAYVEAK